VKSKIHKINLIFNSCAILIIYLLSPSNFYFLFSSLCLSSRFSFHSARLKRTFSIYTERLCWCCFCARFMLRYFFLHSQKMFTNNNNNNNKVMSLTGTEKNRAPNKTLKKKKVQGWLIVVLFNINSLLLFVHQLWFIFQLTRPSSTCVTRNN
jgi:hypothetical protein